MPHIEDFFGADERPYDYDPNKIKRQFEEEKADLLAYITDGLDLIAVVQSLTPNQVYELCRMPELQSRLPELINNRRGNGRLVNLSAPPTPPPVSLRDIFPRAEKEDKPTDRHQLPSDISTYELFRGSFATFSIGRDIGHTDSDQVNRNKLMAVLTAHPELFKLYLTQAKRISMNVETLESIFDLYDQDDVKEFISIYHREQNKSYLGLGKFFTSQPLNSSASLDNMAPSAIMQGVLEKALEDPKSIFAKALCISLSDKLNKGVLPNPKHQFSHDR